MTLSDWIHLFTAIVLLFLYFKNNYLINKVDDKISKNDTNNDVRVSSIRRDLGHLERKVNGPSHYELYHAALNKMQQESELRIIDNSGIKPEDLK